MPFCFLYVPVCSVCSSLSGIGQHEYESAANHEPRDCCTAPGGVAPEGQLLVGNYRF